MECSMQSEENAKVGECRIVPLAESPAYRLVLYITRIQRTAIGEAVCRERGMQYAG